MSMFTRLALGAIACALSALPAWADLMAVNALGAGDGSERCLTGPLCPAFGAYAGANSLISVFETELGKGPFLRVDDGFDTVWRSAEDQFVLVRVRARYADEGSGLQLGNGNGAQPISPAGNQTVWVSNPLQFSSDPRASDFAPLSPGGGWIALTVSAGAAFTFKLSDLNDHFRVNSTGFHDSMVTFQVNDAVPHYFIAWEHHQPRNNQTRDSDYNDLVMEVQYAQPRVALMPPIPEPGTFLFFLAGLLGMLALQRRRAITQNSNCAVAEPMLAS